MLLIIVIVCHFQASTFATIITITKFHNYEDAKESKLTSIEENIVYRALTLIEGDILLDKFCECDTEENCQLQQRNIIELSK